MSVAGKNTLNYLWNKVLILYNKLSARITTLENSTISVEELKPNASTGEITATGATIDLNHIKPYIKKSKIKLGSNIIVFSKYEFSLTNIKDKNIYINFNNSKFTKYKGSSGCISAYDLQGNPIKIYLNCSNRPGVFHLYIIDNISSSGNTSSIGISISTTYLGVE